MKIKTEVKKEDIDVKELKKIFDESVGGVTLRDAKTGIKDRYEPGM